MEPALYQEQLPTSGEVVPKLVVTVSRYCALYVAVSVPEAVIGEVRPELHVNTNRIPRPPLTGEDQTNVVPLLTQIPFGRAL